jgi:ACR3 family arsenite efflux pump ArsB
MLIAGRHNPSRVLLSLFALWVLSPFLALIAAIFWSPTRPTLFWVTLIVTLSTLAIYGYIALGPPRPKTAFVFVVVPPATWILIAILQAFRKWL